uniref:CYP59 n=1 Tax=Arundo donax TaxID=35708 RepID=A0A0A9EJ24_ARUDO
MGVCSTRWRRISWHKLGTQLELELGVTLYTNFCMVIKLDFLMMRSVQS